MRLTTHVYSTGIKHINCDNLRISKIALMYLDKLSMPVVVDRRVTKITEYRPSAFGVLLVIGYFLIS